MEITYPPQPNVELPIRPFAIGIYTALLSQEGTSAPVPIVLHNTIDVIPVWTRTGLGIYRASPTGSINGKTTITCQNTGGNGNDNEITVFGNTDDTIEIHTFSGGSASDDVLNNATLEVRLYKIN